MLFLALCEGFSHSSPAPMSTWVRWQSLFICLAGSVFFYRRSVCVMDRWLFEEQLVSVSRLPTPNIYVCGGLSPLQPSPLYLRVQRSNVEGMFPIIRPSSHTLYFMHCFSLSVSLSFVCIIVNVFLALPSNEISIGVWLMLQILNTQTVSHPSCHDHNPDEHWFFLSHWERKGVVPCF